MVSEFTPFRLVLGWFTVVPDVTVTDTLTTSLI